MLVAAPGSVVGDGERVCARFPARVLFVLDPDAALQRVALRSRLAVPANETAETDGLDQLSKQWMDDG